MDLNSRNKGKLSMPGKDIKRSKNKLRSFEPIEKKRVGRGRQKGRGVIYIGRIPHGFYEDQMTGYFSQFGRVVSAVVSRSKKTGKSKGYGFVEFEDEEVAKIAAETMNNYLMYNKVLKCRYIPEEERRKHKIRNTYGFTSSRVLNRINDARKKKEAFQKLNKTVQQKKIQNKIAEFKKFFEERGMNFDFKINTDKAENSDENEIEIAKERAENFNSNINEGVDDQFGVLEIDPSDADIHFKTPPQVKKVIKKISTSTVISENCASKTVNKTKRKMKTTSKEVPRQKKPAKRNEVLREKKDKKEKTGKLSKSEQKKPSTRKNQVVVTVRRRRRRETVENVQKLCKEKKKAKAKQKCKKMQFGNSTSRILAGEKNN